LALHRFAVRHIWGAATALLSAACETAGDGECGVGDGSVGGINRAVGHDKRAHSWCAR
jgi:hypothetical protein